MKTIISIIFSVILLEATAQQQTFDITTFTAPKGWKKQSSGSAIQISQQDDTKNTYCIITIMKSVPATTIAQQNFDDAWEALVKEMVAVSTAPEMQEPVKENGWEILTGYAPFEKDGTKGVALLVNSSGFQKMVNIIILTNSDAYEKDMTAFLGSIDLKKQTIADNKIIKPSAPLPVTTVAKKDGFTFTTTNFDDGWTSTVQEDWVEVTKGPLKILLHYPKQGTIFPADPEPLTNGAWNILVAPRYSKLRNYKTTYVTSYIRPYLGFGYATENATGKEVYIVFFRQGDTGWLEFIAPDKNTFMQYFKFDPDVIRWDSEIDLLKPMVQMASYNKFAVGTSDFKGNWTSDFTGMQQMYHVNTGNYAGMNMHQSKQSFYFTAGNTYKWELLVVSGMVGNSKYQHVKSSGRFTVPNNWQISFSDIEGRPKKYHAFFSCIKGARILHLLDAASPGSGIYDSYGLKK